MQGKYTLNIATMYTETAITLYTPTRIQMCMYYVHFKNVLYYDLFFS